VPEEKGPFTIKTLQSIGGGLRAGSSEQVQALEAERTQKGNPAFVDHEMPLTVDQEAHPTSGERNDLTTPPAGGTLNDDPVIGKMSLIFHRDGLCEVNVQELGLLTLGRIEGALPQIFRGLMLARAAAAREAQGLPRDFNLQE
jgi:hypothetical protein